MNVKVIIKVINLHGPFWADAVSTYLVYMNSYELCIKHFYMYKSCLRVVKMKMNTAFNITISVHGHFCYYSVHVLFK